MSETLELCIELINRPSVTPTDQGCQALIKKRLQASGFQIEDLSCQDVTNTYYFHGEGEPRFVFVGHTDVVPTGPIEQWQSDPFNAKERQGQLYGRGSADMKGSVAAMIVAIEKFVATHPKHTGQIGLLLTSDEEGPAQFGIRHVVEEFKKQNRHFHYCIVGEPSSTEALGDIIKIGRRGSLNAKLTIMGKQGHIAYPHLADNPIHNALAALQQLCEKKWDNGNEHFDPTQMQISNIHAGTGATNVIPGEMQITFNFRYSPECTVQTLQETVISILEKNDVHFSIEWNHSGKPFYTRPGKLVKAVQDSVHALCERTPHCSTSGGTSDGRFMTDITDEIVEFGPINKTIHQIDEHVSIDDINTLEKAYLSILEKLVV